jgi:hypothetical protein
MPGALTPPEGGIVRAPSFTDRTTWAGIATVKRHVPGTACRWSGAARDVAVPGALPQKSGSARIENDERGIQRPIPTCVGLRREAPHNRAPGSDHPHVRGAQTHTRTLDHSDHGPSPRAWGSVSWVHQKQGSGRSIPTCVGLRENDLHKRKPLSSRNLRIEATSAPHPHPYHRHPEPARDRALHPRLSPTGRHHAHFSPWT